MQYSCLNSYQLSPLERRVRDIQIVIVMNFVVVLSVGIKRVVCSKKGLFKYTDTYAKELKYPNI